MLLERYGLEVVMAFIKDMVRMWLHAWKRFISIALISLLGVAVLTGIYAGCRDAFLATDRFFDTQGLHDIQVLSTAGLTDDDIAALRKISGVAKVQGERSQTVTVDLNGKKTVTMQEIGTNGIDQPYLQSGRMPEKSGEIAVTRKFIKDSGYKKGDHITVTPQDSASSASSATSSVSDSGESDNQAPSFPTELTIVGVVLDPQDLTNPDGYSGTNAFRSSATSDYTFFAPSDGVTGSMYTAVTILVKGAADKDSFSDVYDDTVSEVADRIDGTVRTNRQKARHQELLDAGTKQIDEAKAQADKQFAAAQQQIDSNRSQLNQQIDQIVNMQAGAAAGSLDETTRETLRETVIAASPQLAEAKAQLDQAQSQLDQQKKDTERTLQSKQNELEDSIPQVRWYVQDRSQIGGFSSLKSDLESIQSLGNAFPIVFLLVAVMMSLTAMARMVEEDRGLIGTYTGLGYGRLAVASRYLLFALFACLIGGGLGLIAGFLGIPAFLLVVLRGLYVMPDVRLAYDWLYGTAGVALFVVGVLAATVYACAQEMRQKPASLMRPKAPRAGSRILLERIKPLWNRMSFLGKVTARNIFRFKSRLIMTVGGVAGCTALIVCGLAINDTVAALGAKQYQDVYQYDLMVVANDDDADAMRQKVASDGRVTSSMDVRVESGDLTGDSGSESIQLVAVPDSERSEFGKMVTLQPVRSSWVDGAADTVSLGDDGVIGSDVYVSETYYRQLFDTAASGTSSASSASDSGESDNQNGESGTSNGASSNGQQLVWNAMYAKLKGSGESQAAYAEKLEDDDAVMKAVSCAHMAESFKFDLMGAVVALIVALAGGLALVVLFTLANTNVSEREREMATLKVLGFFDKEVHHYVNREMMVLTMMGVVLGLPLGRFVGGLLTAALNMPALYFEVECTPLSYVIAAGATMAFALLVQLFVNPVLDRIDPISSLKSVE